MQNAAKAFMRSAVGLLWREKCVAQTGKVGTGLVAQRRDAKRRERGAPVISE